MKRLGYPLTWRTRCFINGGCGEAVHAHTNGDGDFVLFDQLGWPWPVHECYFFRTPADGEPRAPGDAWHEVRRIEPTPGLGRIEAIGTLTNYDEAKLGGFAPFRNLPRQAQAAVRLQLGDCQSLVTIVTGGGHEYLAFADLRNVVAAVGDTVGVRLRVITIMNTPVFKVTQVKRIGYDQPA